MQVYPIVPEALEYRFDYYSVYALRIEIAIYRKLLMVMTEEIEICSAIEEV